MEVYVKCFVVVFGDEFVDEVEVGCDDDWFFGWCVVFEVVLC